MAKKSVKRPSKKGAAAAKAPSRPAAKSSVVRPVKPSKSKTAPIRNKVKTTLRAPAKAAKPPTLKPAPSKAAKAFAHKSSTNTPFTPKPARQGGQQSCAKSICCKGGACEIIQVQ